MGDPSAFLHIHRVPAPERDPAERVRDHAEIYEILPEEELSRQGARCMDCGVPFCHEGCPLGNLIPDWNDLVYRADWRQAIDQLHATNNFPEWTGLVCPAPCESACVLAINDDPVMIKQIEYAIVDRAWREGWIVPRPPERRTGRRVAVVGSGPAGLAVAAELNLAGHSVVVFERDEGPGGLVRFGVPDAKLEKWIIDRRVDVLAAEGVELRYGVDVGGADGPTADELRAEYDAVVIATGSRVPRDIDVPGRELAGVEWAMDYLYQRNRWVARSEGRYAPEPARPITAAGKHVVVIGGGDTGMDCVSSATRERAASVVMYDVYPEIPPDGRYPDSPWPEHPRRTVTTYALDEGGTRYFGAQITRLAGTDGHVVAVEGRQVQGTSSRDLQPVEGSEFSSPADLVLVAIGFSGPEQQGFLEQLGCEIDRHGNVKAGASFATSVEGVYACGDARRGQSLIVTAIAEGRMCARAVDKALASDPQEATQGQT